MKIPIATYRLQLHHEFGFKDARNIVPFLADLGVSDIYASPIFKAKKGSLHGYDVVDPNELNPELGSAAEFEELMTEVHERGMGWLQDIVPNHMAFDSENRMLMDVFENGENSPYFGFFDVNWRQDTQVKAQVLAPFLGEFYGEALEGGEIALKFGPAGLAAKYYDLEFPLKVESYVHVFTHRLAVLREQLGDTHSDFIRYLGALYVLEGLSAPEAESERNERIKVIKKTFWDLYNENSTVAFFIDSNLRRFNGDSNDPDSFNLLDDLLSEQVFRLSFWKVAYEEINYRRFFSINNLISMKLENEKAFEHLHSLICKMVAERKFTGLRVDHIDGLYDPAGYLKRLKESGDNVYVVVEKILDLSEELPRVWPVQGTTGYDFLNYVNGLFCMGDNESLMTKAYTGFSGQNPSYGELVYEKKRLIIEKHMGGDVDALARLLKSISGLDRHGRDITLYGLRRVLVEILAQFPVYRTYVNDELVSDRDSIYILEAVQRAALHNPGLLNEFNFLKKFFLMDFGPNISEDEKRQRVRFVMRFQQFSGPLMAKGFEDTLLYVYNRLISLNEVGGSPDKFGIPLEEFHRFNNSRATTWPHSLNATSTHDTKRGEDVRTRINVLSEIPKEWESAVKRWSKLNRKAKQIAGGISIPDRNDEYFLYQTLIGTFPAQEDDYEVYVERLKEYAIKVVREAKVHTAWLKPDVEYENAFLSFLEKIVTPKEDNAFLADFRAYQKRIARFGIFNSLSQVIIKATAPGVPDFFQGTELWDLSLVDPDNRRPVDFQTRMHLFEEMKTKLNDDLAGLLQELLDSREDGRIKLFLIHRLLSARKKRHRIFQEGSYEPLPVQGHLQNHVIAFARIYSNMWAVTVAPRFLITVLKEDEDPFGEKVWKDTYLALPEGAPKSWRDAITDDQATLDNFLPVGKVLRRFPVSLLVSEG
ncbi:MAG: malto-oligosyltrehalose synthase [Candidatus Abyssobacteria bacterium SURF_5]|uniref:Malto-oligosyltrehalose synthase n=1 Tax=Abyssobacteria bacterium (strain SURF_5) TaxID=2093360 RepID=A0A3A4NI04_ABYX5|nr:MAG: malto-oligosyltrehalose synthase [Candidatus Abyssubacteria bacterium SURF_5]